jgi:hypothetical protein
MDGTDTDSVQWTAFVLLLLNVRVYCQMVSRLCLILA